MIKNLFFCGIIVNEYSYLIKYFFMFFCEFFTFCIRKNPRMYHGDGELFCLDDQMHLVSFILIENEFFIILKILTPISASILDQHVAANAHADAASRGWNPILHSYLPWRTWS